MKNEKKIEESETRYPGLFESIRDAILVADTDRNIINCNSAFTEIFGYALNELKGKKTITVYENEEQFIELGKALNENYGNKSFLHTVNYKRKDNSIFPGETAVFYLKNSDGNTAGFIALIRDITERVKAENTLHKFSLNWQQLTKAALQINTVLELPAVMRQLVASARELTGAEEGTAGLLIDGKMVFTEYNQHGNVFPIDYSFVENYGVPGWVMATRKPYISNDAEHDEHVIPEIQKALGFRNLADTPILNKHGEIIGCFEMHNKPGNFDDYDIMLLQNLSAGAAIAIENSQMIIQRQKAETAVRESKENLFVTLQSIGDGVISTDVDGEIVLMNPVAEKLCGWTFKEAEGKPLAHVFKIINAMTREKVENPVKFVMQTGKRIGLANHTVLISKDGKEYQIADSAAPIKDDKGNILGVVLVFTDVTAEYAMREALRESEQRYRSIAQSANDAIVTADDKGIILGWNSAAEKIFGYSEEEVHNQSLTIIIPHQYREKHSAGFRQVSEGSEHKVLGKTIEVEGLNKKGQIFPLELSLSGWESSGRKFYTGIMRDITERKRTEQNIKKLTRGIEQSPATIIITDENGNIEYVNKKFTEITGYSFSEAIGKNPKILKSGHSNVKIYQDLWQKIKAGEEWRGEFCNKKKNGELYWESASISPVINSIGNITNFIAVKEDITEQKKLVQELIEAKESAEKANKIKDGFIASISHEIRTPLNGILGMSSIIKETFSRYVTEDEKQLFDGINSSSNRLIRTVDMILNFSRAQSGDIVISPIKIDLSVICENLVLEFQHAAKSKSLQLTFTKKSAKALIRADEYTVTQSISNLIDNAIKYTTKGTIEVSLYNHNNKIQLDVKDTGIGIDKDYMGKMFTPYTQEDMGYGRAYEGVGLGLSLVQKFLQLNNAEISVQSIKGEGTTFSLYFEHLLIPAENNLLSDKPIDVVMKVNADYKPIALIVEDDAINQFTIRNFLKDNYQSKVIDSSDYAIEMLRANEVEIILMDISIKGSMNGLELTKYLMSTKEFSHIPIIAITAHAFPKDRQNAMTAGCYDYLAKPFSKKDLLNTMDNISSRKRLSKKI
ncbi:MAG: PAS domain S-box protein [Ignavibacteriales bacterium]|nr:PAS domain S-box protein [Ignavibacteriales bacterium]